MVGCPRSVTTMVSPRASTCLNSSHALDLKMAFDTLFCIAVFTQMFHTGYFSIRQPLSRCATGHCFTVFSRQLADAPCAPHGALNRPVPAPCSDLEPNTIGQR